MKKILLKPGFEFIFALGLLVILGLPPVLLAQDQKDLEIKIENGDTTVNGKNIKELSAKDRQRALEDINHIKGQTTITIDGKKDGGGKRKIVIKRKNWEGGDHAPMMPGSATVKDSLGNVVDGKPDKQGDMNSGLTFRYRMNDEPPGRRILRDRGINPPLHASVMHFDRRNSQQFDYVNIDNDGISTHVSFRISEPSNEDLKRMPHVEGPKFEIKDLNLVPQFASGKTLLMFSLLSKATAEAKLTDNEGRIIWNEKVTGGSFSKAFPLGLNGIYYLQVKQGNSVSVKRIVKEE